MFQVETGVAKMNTVAVVVAAEPHRVTAVTNNVNMRSSAANGKESHSIPSGYRAGVPTLVTNSMIGGGRTNPAGPQVEEEEEEKAEAGMSGGADSHLNLLNFSPDEHEPLLSREQLPAESDPIPHLHNRHHNPPGNISSGRGPNSNNNNNRLALDSEQHAHKPERNMCSEISQAGSVSRPKPEAQPQASDTCPCQKVTETGLDPGSTHNPKDQLFHSSVTTEVSAETLEEPFPEVPDFQSSQEQDPATKASCSEALVSDTSTLSQNPSSLPGLSSLDVSASATQAPESAVIESSVREPADLQCLEHQTPGPLPAQMRQTKARRPERPCSLDLSSSCISSGES